MNINVQGYTDGMVNESKEDKVEKLNRDLERKISKKK